MTDTDAERLGQQIANVIYAVLTDSGIDPKDPRVLGSVRHHIRQMLAADDERSGHRPDV